MITNESTLKQKKEILQEISKIYEGLIKSQKISEADAGKILEFVKEKLAAESHADDFSANIMTFCKDFPAFASIAEKVTNKRNELVEKLGQACLEKLMDEDTDTWSKLTTTLEGMKEETLHDWFASLPETSKAMFLSKFLTLSDGI